MKAIYRYEVPVDDAWHTILTHGSVVHVACRTPAVVEFWAHVGGVASRRMFRVFGTGQPLPDDDSVARLVHVGTALTPGGNLVWHLFELVERESETPK